MRIWIRGLRRFAQPFSPSLPAGILLVYLCAAAVAQQSTPKSTPQQGEDPAALRNDIEQLKAQQQLILDRLDELKKLLNTRAANTPPALNVPETMSVEGELFRGDGSAPIVMIEYGDIECPFCRHFKHDIYPRVYDDYIKTGEVRFYFRDMPLPFHEHAMLAARAAHCAGEQGKFWEMHDSLFTDRPEDIGPGPGGRDRSLAQEAIDGRAKALGLDTAKLDACMASTRFDDVIQRATDEAAKMNIDGTPTFVIGRIGPNGNMVSVKKTIIGAQPFEAFKAAIDPLLLPQPSAQNAPQAQPKQQN